MGARRFFVQDAHATGDTVTIAGADAHKIVDVLRLRAGDTIEIVDSSSRVFTARIDHYNNGITASLIDLLAESKDDTVTIDVAQGIPKGQKMDFVVEKLTELGVATIIPLESERTIVRDVSAAKLERWRRLAQTGAQQSGRANIPHVTEPVTLSHLSARFGDYDLVLLPWEIASEPLYQIEEAIRAARRLLVVVGPEGGFSHHEAAAATDAGARAVSLGARILRTETAGLALLSVLNYVGQKSQ